MALSDTSPASLSPLQRAFLALEQTRARLAVAEGALREPIAIIGLGCRVPGAENPANFWELLLEGRDAVGPVPADRWDTEALYDPDPATPGRIATRAGGFLSGIDGFDADFFGIAPREAQGMDPQQRLLLEVGWEALEDAAQAADRLSGSRTGVFVGICSSDYAYLQLKSQDPSLLDAHFSSGIAHSIVAGRVSYLLGLQGPSLAIDTACSSSLVAIHLACQSLRSGDCRMALAGGVNLILSPDIYIALSHSRMLAPDGRCKTFDAAADGFARGEGCGVVVLKRLCDAIADGDRILAQIRGSAVNQDGPSSGLTAPNGPAQEAVIREALTRAGVNPGEVGYVEAHGTGTQLGDPLEVRALGAVFGPGRDPTRSLMLGSVKTNIGHLEGAAGITGLIKLVLALRHRTIPRHLHLYNPSPHIPWSELPLKVPTERTAWEPIGGRRIGGVSSFGFSGTNAHLVVEEAPPVPEVVDRSQGSDAAWCMLALSARNAVALAALARRYGAASNGRSDSELADICHTATAGRAHFAQRATITARTIDELRTRLQALAESRCIEGVRTARVAGRDPPRIAFMYTGQGSQYAGMGRGLYESAPVFRDALDRCAQLLAPQLDRPLFEVLFPATGDESLIDQTAYAQPALFALEYALTQLWRSWGIVPTAVMGHSVGEYVAACVAGVFSLEDALRLIARRGRLMQALPAGGAMAAIFAPEREVADMIASRGLSVAAVNGPAQTVVSGRAAAVDAIGRDLIGRGVRCQQLAVSHAFHSDLMEPMLDAFEAEVARTRLDAPRMRVISNLTGQSAEPDELVQPGYWRRHARQTVRFSEGLKALAARADCIIEIGPHPTLLSFAAATLGDRGPQCTASLRRGVPDRQHILDALACIYLAGAPIEWRSVGDGRTCRMIELPTYPFQRERFWFQAKHGSHGAVRGRDSKHPLLGVRLRSAAIDTIYQGRIEAGSPGQILMPASVWLDTLFACARDVYRSTAVCIENLSIREPLLPGADCARTIQTICAPPHEGVAAASVSSLDEREEDRGAWTLHASANIRAGTEATASVDLQQLRAACANPVDLGTTVRVLRQLWLDGSQALGALEADADSSTPGNEEQLQSLMLHGCLQVAAAAMSPKLEAQSYRLLAAERCVLYRRLPRSCWSHAVVQPEGPERCVADVRIVDDAGELVGELRGLQLQRGSSEQWLDECLYETQWEAARLDAPAAGANQAIEPRTWVLFADSRGVSDALAARLRASADECVLVKPAEFASGADGEPEYARVFSALRHVGRAICGVIHAGSLDIESKATLAADDPITAQNQGALSVLRLAQALLSESRPPPLWILTRGAQPVDRNALSPAQATVWGLAKAMNMERSDLACVCIDLDPASTSPDIDALQAELLQSRGERYVAFRGRERYVARLAPLRRSAVGSDSGTVRQDGTYLITGGLSGIGLIVARWLAHQGAGRLVLIGRRGLTTEATPIVEELRAGGTVVIAESVDVSDENALSALLTRLRAAGPPLRGIIHSAAVIDDAALERQDAQRFARVLAPKVQGGWLLDKLTRCDALDWFVLFSSVAGVFGSAGQCNYSAANAYLDALAHDRHNRGLPALSVDWGAWADIGATSDPDLMQRIAARGLGALRPENGLLALQKLLASGCVQAAVMPVDWKRFLESYPQSVVPPFLARIAAAHGPSARSGTAAAPESRFQDLRQQLMEAPLLRRRPLVAAFVQQHASQVLGLRSSRMIDPRTPLGELGLDSLLAVELRNTLSRALEVSLPTTLLFDYPSIEALSEFLLCEVLRQSERPATTTASEDQAPSAAALVGSIEAMLEEDVDRRIEAYARRKA
jgi:acyl transferase domain-containing protein/acyl carrier protein